MRIPTVKREDWIVGGRESWIVVEFGGSRALFALLLSMDDGAKNEVIGAWKRRRFEVDCMVEIGLRVSVNLSRKYGSLW